MRGKSLVICGGFVVICGQKMACFSGLKNVPTF
jgi:hypothetical protein